MSETPEHRLKRLRMRSWRRGTKEMDMVLGPYADTQIAKLSPDALDAYESMLDETDLDLYVWVSGQAASPTEHADFIKILRDFHKIR